MEKKKIIISYLIVLGVIFIFLLVYGSGVFVSPFYGDINLIDEGQYASWLSRMNLGGQLYKDVYAAYGPLYIYPLYLFNLIFDPSVFLIRVVYGVLSVFLAILISIYIFKKLKIPFLFQLLPLFLLTFFPGFGIRQAIGLVAITLVYISFEKNKIIWGLIAGFSITCAFLIGSDSGIFTLLTCLVFIILKIITSQNLRQVFINIFTIFLGSAILFLAFFLWASYEGWFNSYLTSTIYDLTTYSGINLPIGQKNISVLEIFKNPLSLYGTLKFVFSKGTMIYWVNLFYLVMFVFLAVKFIKKTFVNSDKLIFLISIFGFLISTVLIGRNGHISFVLPPIFILFGYILFEINKKYISTKNIKDKLVLIALVFVIFVFSERLVLVLRPHFYLLFKIPFKVLDKKDNPAYVGNISISEKQKKSFIELKNYVDQNIDPKDEIFFFSNTPMMYLVINRNNPNKYDLPEVASIKEKRFEILRSLKVKKTRYIIEDRYAWSVDGISNGRRLPEVYEYILKNYTKEEYGQYIIYKLKVN